VKDDKRCFGYLDELSVVRIDVEEEALRSLI